MLRLKLQYFSHLIQRTDSLEKTLMLGKNEGRRRRGQQPCSDSSATPSFPSQPEGKIGLPRANPRGRLKCETVLGTLDATSRVP